MKKIFVAGHRGMVGSAICRQLQKKSDVEIITRTRSELDLCDQSSVHQFMKAARPDQVILAAAKVGGIHANNTFPAEFIYQNLQIQSNVIHAAHLNDVQKLLFLGSSCVYPRAVEQPMREDALLTGILEPTNEPYAIAKIAGIKMCESYNRQYGRDFRSVMPTNLYGPGDNYHPENSHVVPALIRRFHEAKVNNFDEVVVWGSGTPMREFLYVDDMAEASLFVHKLDSEIFSTNTDPMLSHINVGTGTDVTIKKLAKTVQDVVGFNGELVFDSTKPDGTPRKLRMLRLLSNLGWKASVSLKLGIERSYADFLSKRSGEKRFINLNKNVIVTGGAGYIGSHACKALRNAGYTPITVDNLSTGWSEAVKFGPFERVDLLDRTKLDRVFKFYQPHAVMHFAAFSQVGESVDDPIKYWHNNVMGSVNLFQACAEHRCERVIFSSTCATYGDHDNVVLTEATEQRPVNAYGASKRAVEEMLRQISKSAGLKYTIFRYFNVAGADPDGDVGEFHKPETHLIPLILDAIDGKRDQITIFGTDYETPDGTCIRDYVHVCDLVDAHLLGLKWLENGGCNKIFNLGTGTGFSVREVIEHASVVTNRQVPIFEGARREGDCTKLVSGSELARVDLGWEPKRSSLRHMITDAWRWHKMGGYKK